MKSLDPLHGAWQIISEERRLKRVQVGQKEGSGAEQETVEQLVSVAALVAVRLAYGHWFWGNSQV